MTSMRKALTSLTLLTCILYFVNSGHGAPKTVSDHKINFGWPNFFNPEMGMRREKKEEKGEKDEAENNAVDTSSHDDEYEDLIDYTLKGGLRGTLLLLNSTSLPRGTNLTTSEMKNLTEAAKMVMKEEEGEDNQEEENGGGNSGEIQTEEGLRLRTPIVTKKHPVELGKYGAKITFYADDEPTKFIYYGNWCGRGGRSAPVDPVDRCCLEHDKCYGRAVKQCPDVWRKPYNRMYAWTLLDKEVVCVRSESSCVNHICDCDREAAVCFTTGLYHATTSYNTTHIGTKAL